MKNHCFKLALVQVTQPGEVEVQPPLGLASIASYLRKYLNFTSTIILAEPTDNTVKRLIEEHHSIIGISSVTQNFSIAVEFARRIKNELNVPVIIGGVHISSLPHTLPDCFDIGVIGEGEETVKELLEMFLLGEFDKKKLATIKGIAFHENGRVAVTSPRELISDLDTIPLPARELLSLKGSLHHILTSRGCPYRCSFCSSSVFWRRIRYFSPERVVHEIKELIGRYNAKHISIWDDIFMINRARMRRIVRLIRSEKIHRKVSFGCSARANLVDQEICGLMKSMNVTHVSLGLESGSERVLRYLKKGSAKVSDNEKAIDLLTKNGFVTKGSFIIGSPGETKEDMLATLKFIKETNLDGGAVYPAVAFPQTEFWSYALERGLVSDDMDWGKLTIRSKFSELKASNYILLSEHVSMNELLDTGRRIEMELDRRETHSLFNTKKLTLENVKLAIGRPDLTFKLIKSVLRYMVRKMFKIE